MRSTRTDKNNITFVKFLTESEHYINDKNITLIERISEIAKSKPITEESLATLFSINTGHYEPAISLTTALLTQLKNDPEKIKDIFLTVTKHALNELFEKSGDINNSLEALLNHYNLLNQLKANIGNETLKIWILKAYFNKQILPLISSKAYSMFDNSEVMRANIIDAFNQLLDDLVEKININEFQHDDFYDCIDTLDVDDFELTLDIKPYKEDITENKEKMDQFSYMLLFNATPDYFYSILRNGNSKSGNNTVLKELKDANWSLQKGVEANSTASNQKALLRDLNRNVYFDSKLYSGKGNSAIKKTLIENLGRGKFEILEKYYTQNCVSTALMLANSGGNLFSAPTADLQNPNSQGRIGNIKIENDIAYMKTVYPVITHRQFNDNGDPIENNIPGTILFKSQLDLSKDDGIGFVVTNIAASNQALTNLLLTDDHITDTKKLIDEAKAEEDDNIFKKLKYLATHCPDEFDLPKQEELKISPSLDSMIQHSEPLPKSTSQSPSSPRRSTSVIDTALSRKKTKKPTPQSAPILEEQEPAQLSPVSNDLVTQHDMKNDVLDEDKTEEQESAEQIVALHNSIASDYAANDVLHEDAESHDFISYKKPGLFENFKPWIIAGAAILGTCATIAILAAIPPLGIGAAIATGTIALLKIAGLTVGTSVGLSIGLGTLAGLPSLGFLATTSIFAKPKKIMSHKVSPDSLAEKIKVSNSNSLIAERTGAKPKLEQGLDETLDESSSEKKITSPSPERASQKLFKPDSSASLVIPAEPAKQAKSQDPMNTFS